MIKVYSLTRMRSGKFKIHHNGMTFELNFAQSYGSDNTGKGKLIVSDPNVQEAIESNAMFGSLYVLTGEYEDKTVAANQSGIQASFRGVGHDGNVKRRTQAQIDAEKANEQVTPENAVADTKAKRVNSKIEKKKDVVDKRIFTNKNDVLNYLSSKGIVPADEEEFIDLMDKYNLEIED